VEGESGRWEDECESGLNKSGRWEVRVEGGKASVKGG
jgi:hypothetical protein